MEILDYVLIITGGLLLLAGLIGCFLPVLPGPPISFAGLLLLHFTGPYEFSAALLITLGVLAVGVSILDNVLPAVGAGRSGGSNRAVWGAALGLVVGIFFPPFGIILGPFAGALIFELTAGKNFKQALKTSFGSFGGFVTATALKAAVSVVIIFYFAVKIIRG